MANNIEKQLKEISERLEQGVKEIFTSERYTEYLNTMSKFHNYRKNAPADTKSLDFSMYMSFSIKSVQSPLECGDFYFPVLMFEEYTVNYPYYSNFKPPFPAARF